MPSLQRTKQRFHSAAGLRQERAPVTAPVARTGSHVRGTRSPGGRRPLHRPCGALRETLSLRWGASTDWRGAGCRATPAHRGAGHAHTEGRGATPPHRAGHRATPALTGTPRKVPDGPAALAEEEPPAEWGLAASLGALRAPVRLKPQEGAGRHQYLLCVHFGVQQQQLFEHLEHRLV